MIEYSGIIEGVEKRFLTTTIVITLLAGLAIKKKSLNRSGVVAAIVVGTLTCLCGWTFAIALLAFYQSSSSLTKYKSSIKKKIEGDAFQKGGQRNYIQVFSNSLTATIVSVIYFIYSSDRRNIPIPDTAYPFECFLIGMIIGHYGCCNGDTWASELGILNKGQPRLITTLKYVPPGTNGGVSRLGLIASVLGGTFIGLVYFIASWFFNDNPIAYQLANPQYPIILLGTFAGLFGSLLDSLMGATIQYSGYDIKKGVVVNHKPTTTDQYKKVDSDDPKSPNVIAHLCGLDILDNHQVNFLSSLITAFVCGYISLEKREN
ncbi:hypothetical protein DFA_11962 [Cavenderia fasciculata]|uniref:Transmembrane protein 19 n=1 Tax=Cavenderia fasciculata TaxID=261658 RepID=F4QEY6_CACFS|nr:uncharacterized protein DFA_11962 [Cavenderia fasciculata]EGG14193.1 hypothetical protein DFA_11962 [Cavenderia fasciculata]|eukprot:XP_004350901.1 hypothetical protein DFA_11962 [Cavenderia fasciculata]